MKLNFNFIFLRKVVFANLFWDANEIYFENDIYFSFCLKKGLLQLLDQLTVSAALNVLLPLFSYGHWIAISLIYYIIYTRYYMLGSKYLLFIDIFDARFGFFGTKTNIFLG